MPTKTSKIINGRGIIYGLRNAITSNKTSPAKIFPNSLNENDRALTLSDIISKNPRINLSGFAKFKNLAMYCLTPNACKEKNWMEKTENNANANVVVKSLLGERNTDSVFELIVIKNEPKNPGIRDNRFALTIKRKNVEIKGRIFLDRFLF